MKNTVKYWFGPLFHLFFPRCCAVCGASLIEGEDTICTHCNIDMPRTNYHKMKDNPVERMFWGKFPLEHAASYFFEDAAKNATTFPIKSNKKTQKFYSTLGYTPLTHIENTGLHCQRQDSADILLGEGGRLPPNWRRRGRSSGRDSRNRRSRRN